MEIETVMAINEDLYRSQLRVIEVIMQITTLCVLVGFVLYLIGSAWLCWEETRQRARRRPAPMHRDRFATRVAPTDLLLKGSEKPTQRAASESLVPLSQRSRCGIKLLNEQPNQQPRSIL
jgi:hypothetical protein